MAKYVTFMPDGITLQGRSVTVAVSGPPTFIVPYFVEIMSDYDWSVHVPTAFADQCDIGKFLVYDIEGAEWTGSFDSDRQLYAVTGDHAVVTISIDYQNFMLDQLTNSDFEGTDTYILRYNLVLDSDPSKKVYWDCSRTIIQNTRTFKINRKIPHCEGYTFLGWSTSPLGAPLDSNSTVLKTEGKSDDFWVSESQIKSGQQIYVDNSIPGIYQGHIATLYAIWKDNLGRMVIPSGLYLTKANPYVTQEMECGTALNIGSRSYPQETGTLIQSPFEFHTLYVGGGDGYECKFFTGMVVNKWVDGWLGGSIYNVVLYNYDGSIPPNGYGSTFTPTVYNASASLESDGDYSYSGTDFGVDRYSEISPFWKNSSTCVFDISWYSRTLYFEHLPYQAIATPLYTYLAVNSLYEPGNKKLSGRYLVYSSNSLGNDTQEVLNKIFPTTAGPYTESIEFSVGGTKHGSSFKVITEGTNMKVVCDADVVFANGNPTSSSNMGWDFYRAGSSISHVDYTPQSVSIPLYCFMQLADNGEFCYPGRIYGGTYDIAGFNELYWSLPNSGAPTEIYYSTWEDSYESTIQAIQVFADGKFLAEIPYCSPAEYANNDYFSEKLLHVPTALPLIPPDCACLYFRGVTRSLCTGGDYQNWLLMIPGSVNTVGIPEPSPAVMSDNKFVIDTSATAKYHDISYIGLEHGETGTITIESNMFDLNTFDDYVTHDDRYEFNVTAWTPITTEYGNPYATRAESPMSATVEYYYTSPYIVVKLPSTRGYIILDTKDKICEKNIKVKLL